MEIREVDATLDVGLSLCKPLQRPHCSEFFIHIITYDVRQPVIDLYELASHPGWTALSQDPLPLDLGLRFDLVLDSRKGEGGIQLIPDRRRAVRLQEDPTFRDAVDPQLLVLSTMPYIGEQVCGYAWITALGDDDGLFDSIEKLVSLHGLGHVGIATGSVTSLFQFRVLVRAHHDNGDGVCQGVRFDLPAHFVSVHARHEEVQYYQGGTVRADGDKGFGTGSGGRDGKSTPVQIAFLKIQEQFGVIYKEDLHSLLPALSQSSGLIYNGNIASL